MADLRVDPLCVLSERLRSRGHFQRGPPAFECHLHLGIGNELVLDALAHFAFNRIVVSHAQHPHIRNG